MRAPGVVRGSHARWWVARSMGSLGRNDEGGLAGDGGLVNDWPTAPPHPTKSSHARWWVPRSMGSLGRNDEVGLVGVGGL